MHSIVKQPPFFDDQLGFLIPSPFTLKQEAGTSKIQDRIIEESGIA